MLTCCQVWLSLICVWKSLLCFVSFLSGKVERVGVRVEVGIYQDRVSQDLNSVYIFDCSGAFVVVSKSRIFLVCGEIESCTISVCEKYLVECRKIFVEAEMCLCVGKVSVRVCVASTPVVSWGSGFVGEHCGALAERLEHEIRINFANKTILI